MDGSFKMDGIDSKEYSTTAYLDGSSETPSTLNISLEATTTLIYSKDGEQAGHETQISTEAAAGRFHRDLELKYNNSQLCPCLSPAEELPRRNFHIPRKNKEKKGLFQCVAPDSREFADIMKVLTSSYLQTSSAGTFIYSKAQLVHSELLEKDFVEKRKELKQDSRTDNELSESYSFLLLDCYKIREVCEKGLLIGHSRLGTLGDPTKGVYLSRYSDLLQNNPFVDGATGEIVIFKVLKGRVKTVKVSKNMWDPTPNFECHVLKNSNKVTSCLSYRAFEFTQQYFYEYAFDNIRTRPRHVCPYAVVTFFYQDKVSPPIIKPMAALRSNSGNFEGSKELRSYTLWSGQLLSQGQVTYQAIIRSSAHCILPLKLPEKLEIGTAMKMDDIKQKIPMTMLSWQTYRETGQASQDGLHCSLFVVEDSSKQGSGLSSLITMLEKENMVLVKPLIDKGFLLLLSSGQIGSTQDIGKGWTRCLQALFVFRESRDMKMLVSSRESMAQDAVRSESQGAVMSHVKTFLPALHFALWNLRSKPVADLASEVEQQARGYLVGQFSRTHRRYCLSRYRHSYDEPGKVYSDHKQKHSMDSYLRSYFYCPKVYQLAVPVAQEMVETLRNPMGYTPLSDCQGSKGRLCPDGECGQSRGAQAEDDPGKIEELLNLIHMQKKSLVEDEVERNLTGDGGKRKRKAQSEAVGLMKKYLCLEENKCGAGDEECDLPDSLSTALSGVGVSDTDLRQWQLESCATSDANTLLGILLGTLEQALGQVHETVQPSSRGDVKDSREELQQSEEDLYKTIKELGLPTSYDIDLRKQPAAQEPAGEEACESMSSLDAFSPCSSSEVQPGPDLTQDAPVPWRLIPLTDIKPCKYFASEKDNPFDPRFVEVSRSSAGTDPKPGHTSATRQEGCVSGEVDQPALSKSKPGSENTGPAGSAHNKDAKDTDVVNKKPSETESVLRERSEKVDNVFRQEVCGVDSVLSEEFSGFYTDVQDVLRREHVHHSSELSQCFPQHWHSGTVFSEYVRHYTRPVPVDSYVSTLRESMRRVIGSPAGHEDSALVSSAAPSPGRDPICHAHTPTHTSLLSRSASPKTRLGFPPQKNQPLRCVSPPAFVTNVNSIPQTAKEVCSTDLQHLAAEGGTSRTCLDAKTSSPGITPCSTSISNVIRHIKPEVFCSLVEIIKDVQKNTVKFYIHAAEENTVCSEIKSYLIRLGNAECKPRSFLKSENAQDKLLIIIQNKDIAAHVHTIPSLLCLKKLPSVSFAGVDSVEDVKNRTYNELFVSGGLVVPDELVLLPDFITHGRLQLFLSFLEEKSSADMLWRLKVHCKTQKKLKELGKFNSNATDLLRLLSVYQRRHVVEFLPYHDCDSGTRHAPDLDCLIRLQAQHTLYRHVIFLTARRFEMFPCHSANGIIVTSISDIMDSLPYLTNSNANGIVPSTERSADEDMSLSPDSEEDSQSPVRPASQLAGELAEFPPLPPPLPPETEHFRPPLPDQDSSEAEPASSSSPDRLLALKQAIDQFKASRCPARHIQSFDNGCDSLFDRNFNPYQTFLCPDLPQPVGLPSETGSGCSLACTFLSPPFSSPQALADSHSSGIVASGNSVIFSTQEVREVAGFLTVDNLASAPAVLPVGGGGNGTGLPAVTSHTVSIDCSNNMDLCNWRLQQSTRSGQQTGLSHNHFLWNQGHSE